MNRLLRMLALAATVAPALSQPALAQSAPRIRPSRDVVVTYQVDGEATKLIPGGLPGPVVLSWDAAGQRLRAEAEGRSQIALLDLRARTGQAVDSALRIVLPLPIKQDTLQPLTLEGVRLTPLQPDSVAGLACTTYAFDSKQGPGSVCLTADGVPLKGQGSIQGRPGSFVATSVRYGPLPPGLFTVPPGYLSLAGEGGGASLKGLAERLGGSNDLRRLLGHGQ